MERGLVPNVLRNCDHSQPVSSREFRCSQFRTERRDAGKAVIGQYPAVQINFGLHRHRAEVVLDLVGWFLQEITLNHVGAQAP